MSTETPFFGKTEQLIDRIPFLGENKYVEVWEYTTYFMGFKLKPKQVEIVKRLRNSDIAASNNTFDFLKGSPGFLNILLNNINSCILLLNKENKLTAFNDNLKTIFSNKKDEELFYQRCGEAIGCAYQIEQQTECGSTSMCSDCELRNALMHTLSSGESIYKDEVVRPFFNTEGIKIFKHLQFSTHAFPYQKDKYAIMLIEDISKFYRPADSA